MEVLIKNALVSVFDKTGLDSIIKALHQLGVVMYSTGGTADLIEGMDIPVHRVENLTGYPSILDGRVKTLHPKVFGGILAKREEGHLSELTQYEIPQFDLVVVDLYPFEKTLLETNEEGAIIEKIDIGGISLIRAAAKNHQYVVVIPSQQDYATLLSILTEQKGSSSLVQRKLFAARAFEVSSHYDAAIYTYFSRNAENPALKISLPEGMPIRYGENPHQHAVFYGDMNEMFEFISGKELSYNNLVDVDAAVALMREFKYDRPTFAIIKHTNACGVATRDSALNAWHAALAADPVSAFGGIFITNATVDVDTAKEVDGLFYEILIAKEFTPEALKLLSEKKKRIILKLKHYGHAVQSFKSILNGMVSQDIDLNTEGEVNLSVVTTEKPTPGQIKDLLFANICAKHLKSNTIVLVHDLQMIGMGCGQTSRVDACHQAIDKARRFGFETAGSVMASDAFFPFPDCVEIAHNAGITAVIQPGGSIKDQLSVDYCNEHQMAMVQTGVRHFRH
ncbi:MAG: bifunctional phosphoribosylaminoimidazolecarboxamide formyltransferase/IMP cyclohydrolase [Saprospiraceae bacterium]|nr:bifunctional phosphoribosylaminoimidazolecarboxamide formyltransferase/IMP cyclohydrolase [Saprospiraceae bacterium]